jgi:Flp pilus assembly protein TadD
LTRPAGWAITTKSGTPARVPVRLSLAASAFDRRWTAEEPNNASAWYVQGVALAHLNRDPEAVTAYEKAVALRELFPAVWNNRL